MKNIIHIDVDSFFRSGYKTLSWSLEKEGSIGSRQQESQTEENDMREAVKTHIINITKAIAEKGDLIDFEISLIFSREMEEKQRNLFTELFNEYNTRDERT